VQPLKGQLSHAVRWNYLNLVGAIVIKLQGIWVNILVGTNNSGKSSVLQGIHLSILAEVVRRSFQRTTIPEQALLYLPASDFSYLRKDIPYSNYSGQTSSLYLQESSLTDSESEKSFEINISKGRNFGNIRILNFVFFVHR
jgi:AAA15 family ATPase/GTPase